MKRLFASVFLGIMVLLGSYSATEATEIQTQKACDGCIVFTKAAFERFAIENSGQSTNDPVYKSSIMHFQHVRFTCKCGRDCPHSPMGVYGSK